MGRESVIVSYLASHGEGGTEEWMVDRRGGDTFYKVTFQVPLSLSSALAVASL